MPNHPEQQHASKVANGCFMLKGKLTVSEVGGISRSIVTVGCRKNTFMTCSKNKGGATFADCGIILLRWRGETEARIDLSQEQNTASYKKYNKIKRNQAARMKCAMVGQLPPMYLSGQRNLPISFIPWIPGREQIDRSNSEGQRYSYYSAAARRAG